MYHLTWFFLPFVVVSYLCACLLVFLAIRYRARLRTTAIDSNPGYSPKAAVIVPCKGLDLSFENNVLVLLEQDYPDYEVIFVTADRDDPAYSCLEQLVVRFPDRARLTTAGVASQRSQKVHNQLAALQIADRSSEVYVFVDSDGRPDARFLKHLIAPLLDPQVGATTGYRWFVPIHRRLLEILVALWGAIVASVQADPQFTQLWGGAMAIRRQLFETLNVTQVWSRASTDDDALTRILLREGVPIVFVPRCFVLSTVDYSVGQFMAWGTRQVLLMRVYLPQMWRQLFALTVFSALAPVAGLVLTIVALTTNPNILAVGLILAATGLGSVIATAIIARSTESFLAALGQSVTPLAWWDFLAGPVEALALLAQFIQSGLTRRLTWRDVTYELLAPDRTVVIKTR